MSPANAIHTRFPSGVTLLLGAFLPNADAPVPHQDDELWTTCERAHVANKAMTALALSVAHLTQSDPRHAAAHAAVDLIRPEWTRDLHTICGLVPSSRRGLQAKSAVLAALIERDERDAVVGGPVAELAASLAGDLLHGPDPDLAHRP